MAQIVDHCPTSREKTDRLSVRTGGSHQTGELSQSDILAVSLSAQLRTQIACLHEQTEVLLGLPDAIQTLAHYRILLCQFLGLYGPLERSLTRFSEWGKYGFALPSPSQSDCLVADLAVLGIDVARVSYAPHAALPPLPSFAHALGALYVLEGSTLGGRVILRDVETRFGPHVSGATQFFGGRGKAVGQMWQTFKTGLDAFGHEWPNLHVDVAEGAGSVFRAINAWFAPLQITTACQS